MIRCRPFIISNPLHVIRHNTSFIRSVIPDPAACLPRDVYALGFILSRLSASGSFVLCCMCAHVQRITHALSGPASEISFFHLGITISHPPSNLPLGCVPCSLIQGRDIRRTHLALSTCLFASASRLVECLARENQPRRFIQRRGACRESPSLPSTSFVIALVPSAIIEMTRQTQTFTIT